MKTLKKLSGIFIFIVILGLVIVKLMANKKEQDKELRALLDYNVTTPVEVVSADYGTVQIQLTENGVTQSDKQIEVLSETQGRVIAVAGESGDKIAAGQVLLQVEQEVIQSQLQLAKENLAKAAKDLQRFKKLASVNAVTKQQLEQVELNHQNAMTNFTSLNKQMENTTVRSPINGFISSRSVEKGSIVTPGMPLMTVVAQNEMNFVVKMAESNISSIYKGQEVEVKADVLPGKTYPGKVKEVSVNADLSGRYEVLIQLQNKDFSLRAGMNGTAVFRFKNDKQQIVLPRKCIMGSIQKASVFVVQADSVVERKVQVTPLNTSEVAVSYGLNPGEQVVLSGHINLSNGTSVNIINR